MVVAYTEPADLFEKGGNAIGRCRGNKFRSTIVCVDTYDDHVPGGRYYNPSQKDGVYFSGLMEFLLKMERMLNIMEFPQSFSAPRTFMQRPEPLSTDPPGSRRCCGELATFEVKILFRQNASWQGSITWLEEGREEHFRSVLELAILMDSALTSLCREKTTA